MSEPKPPLAQPTTGYQRLELPDGQVVPGHDRGYLDKWVFGEDIKGKSLLDIGSYHGHFCLEALRRGASRVVGLEPYTESIEYARQLATSFGLKPEYVQADFEDWDSSETFDIVLCLNVLHHMYDPVHALRRMIKLARQKIVLEISPPAFGDAKLNETLARLPIIAQGVAPHNTDIADRTYMFTPSSIAIVFNHHTSAFEPLVFERSPFEGRVLVEARKRRIDHVTAVAGPTSAGKSTFVEKILASQELRRQLGIPEEVSASTAALAIQQLPARPQHHVVFHYDMLRPFDRSMRTHERDPSLDFLEGAGQLTFLTLMTPKDRIREQLKKNEIEIDEKNPGLPRYKKLYQLYGNHDFLKMWYANWMRYCEWHRARTAKHLIVENQGDYSFHPVEQWQEIYGRLFPE